MGVDPDMFWQNLNVSVEAVKGANTTQEMMKAQPKRQTEVVNVADRNNYSLTTSYIDVISGAYGKFTPEAKQLRRLRSQLHRPIAPPKQAEAAIGPPPRAPSPFPSFSFSVEVRLSGGPASFRRASGEFLCIGIDHLRIRRRLLRIVRGFFRMMRGGFLGE